MSPYTIGISQAWNNKYYLVNSVSQYTVTGRKLNYQITNSSVFLPLDQPRIMWGHAGSTDFMCMFPFSTVFLP